MDLILYLANHQVFSLFYSLPFISAAADSLRNDRIYSIQHITWASHIHLGDVRHSASCANVFNKSPLRNGQVHVGDEQADVGAWDMPAAETRLLLMPSQTKLQILVDKSSCVSRRRLRMPEVFGVVRLGWRDRYLFLSHVRFLWKYLHYSKVLNISNW